MPTNSKSSAPSPAPEVLFTVREIARRGKVSEKTVRRLITRGELKAHRIGTSIRVSQADWQTYLAEGGAS